MLLFCLGDFQISMLTLTTTADPCPGNALQLWLKRTDDNCTDKVVMVQIFSDVPLETSNLPSVHKP